MAYSCHPCGEHLLRCKHLLQLYANRWSAAGGPGDAGAALGRAAQEARFVLDDRSFSIWDVSTHAWKVVPGSFGLMVGASSADIRLRGNVTSGTSQVII